MLRKALAALAATAIISGALWSWAATSFQLQTKLSNSGGYLQVRNNPIQTVVGTVVYSNFTTANPIPVKVTANPGYTISSLFKSGISQPIGNYTSHYSTTFQKSSGTTQSFIVGFSSKKYLVTGAVVGPGTISPTSTLVTHGGSLTLSALPQSTSTVITNVTGGTATTIAGESITFPYAGQVKVPLTNITAPTAVTAYFLAVGATAGGNQTSAVFSQVTLEGSIVGGGTPLWSQASGPAVTLAGADTLNPTFTPGQAGSYVFRLTQMLGGKAVASATTEVKVVDSLVSAMRSDCNGCHGAGGVLPAPQVFSSWSSSGHKVLGVSCVSCHSYGAMPTPVNPDTVDAATFVNKHANAGPVGGYYCAGCHSQALMTAFDGSLHKAGGLKCSSCHTGGSHNPDPPLNVCQGCHFDGSGTVPQHPVEIGTSPCTSCHNPHSAYAALQGTLDALHYNNMTSGTYPASYVTSRGGCTDCHYKSATNLAIRQAWYTSGHARVKSPAWTAYDFKTVSGCVQCHSTTGFVNYSTGKATAAWGVASDKTKELLTCRGCHTNTATGALRSVAPLRPFANDKGYLNPSVGKSNLCMTCHSGTNTGAGIAAGYQGGADFTNLAFTPPHYAAAGGTMYAKAGYHFPGRSYQVESTHSSLGAATATGPCVTCHRSGDYGHTFRSGVSDLCAQCHGSALPAAQLAADRATFADTLEVLRAQLAAKGFVYADAAPHFNEHNWGWGEAGANTQGAAYNYVLLAREPGAFAHNPQYAKQLALDSVDYLDNGRIDDSVSTLAIPTLRDAGGISQEVAESVTSFKSRNLCITCHGGSSSTANPMASNAHAAHLTGVYGPGFYLGGGDSSCQACHAASSATHVNGSPDLLNGAGSLCLGCHAGAAPAWNDTARIECTVCHAATPAVLPNGVAAPYKADFAGTGHGRYAVSNGCTVCHDPSGSHISGSTGDHTRLRMQNDNNLCAFCHNDPDLVGVAFRNMSTHRTKEGGVLSCRDCHDPHGSSNRSMIRARINGSGVAFTDRVDGLIDPVTNLGLCQVCHTRTAHYRAGVRENGHFSSDCLSCHPHNSPGGAFRPIGGFCDSCHGYPPAPKNTGTFFGGYANWANARYEDYSGGGGAHLVAAHISPFANADEGWVNCTLCHNGGLTGSAPQHRMTTPVKDNIANVTVLVDHSLRFGEGFTVYTGARLSSAPGGNASGSCFNIACHMSPSVRWSTTK